jgi:hypothetical protein
MDLSLPDETSRLADELRAWARNRPIFAVDAESDQVGWKQLTEFGIFDVAGAGGTVLDTAVGIMAAAHAPLPGPVVEAALAVRANPDLALPALERSEIVTSARSGPAGRSVVGWGARASLVIDESDGERLAEGPLPRMRNAYELPHGWLQRDTAVEADSAALALRWLLSAAAVTGLAAGAFELTLQHTRDREVFGAPLAARQAVQLRLAESRMLLEGCELGVWDAAWRSAQGDPRAAASAALTWIFAATSAEQVLAHCQQLFGALGFCTETGLFRIRAQARWLRLASPRQEASEFVMAAREPQSGVPVSLVLEGFRTSAR